MLHSFAIGFARADVYWIPACAGMTMLIAGATFSVVIPAQAGIQ
jgi:hypothetical protein